MPDEPAPTPTPAAPATPPTPPAPAAAAPPAPAPQASEQPLGEAGLKALQAEREARAEAERRYNAEKAAREALEREKLSKEQQLELDAKQGREALQRAVQMTQYANLVASLAGKGLVGPKALAAARLIDRVEFDPNSHLPTNLDARLEAAKATYGADLFTGATPTPTPTPPAPGATPAWAATTPPAAVPPTVPETVYHQGPRATPAPDENAQFEAFFSQHFPQATSS